MHTDLEHRTTRTYARAGSRNHATAGTYLDTEARRTTRRHADAVDAAAEEEDPLQEHTVHVAPADAFDPAAAVDAAEEDPLQEHVVHVAPADAFDPNPAPQKPEDPHPTPGDLATADLLDQHGKAEAALGHYALARALHERAIAMRRHYRDADPRRIQSLTFLATLALREHNLDEAQRLFDQAHAEALQLHGSDHPATARTLNNLGVLARRRRDPIRAADHYEDALAVKLAAHGWDHPSVASTLVNLGNLTRASGDLKAALHYFARACETFESREGPRSRGLATALVGMGRVHLQMGIHTSASFMLERALLIRESLHVTPAQLAGVRFLLATALEYDEPARARELVASGLQSYLDAAEHPDPRHIESMRAWLTRFDRKHR